MIQPKYNKQNNTTFLGFDSIEINLICIIMHSPRMIWIARYDGIVLQGKLCVRMLAIWVVGTEECSVLPKP